MKKKQVKQVYDWDNKQKSLITHKRTRKVNWFRVSKLIAYVLMFMILIALLITWFIHNVTILH